MTIRKATPLNERFWKYVNKTDKCWLWTGSTTNGGYGVIQSGRRPSKLIRAHRLSWEIHSGQKIADDLHMCHRCDVPGCVRPDHLFLGTPHDNMLDKCLKGRARCGGQRGTVHHAAKLKDADVLAIRASSKSQNALAREFSVSGKTIFNVIHRRIWTHV